MARSSAVFCVIGIGGEVIHDRSLARAAVEKILETVQSGIRPVIAIVARDSVGPLSSFSAFLGLLSECGLCAELVTRDQLARSLPEIARETVPIVLPCEASIVDDEYAVSLAATLGCALTFLTASDCVMTGNPAHCEDATIVEHANFIELMELADSGTGVVSAGATHLAWQTNTAFKVFALTHGRWTSVTSDTYTKTVRPIASIAVSQGLALIEARRPDLSGDATWTACNKLLGRFAQLDVPIEQMQLLRDGLRFVSNQRDSATVAEHFAECGFQATIVESCAKLCVVGTAVLTASGVIHAILQALDNAGVKALQVSDSNATVSVIVPGKDAPAAERAVHSILTVSERITPSDRIAFDATTRILRVRGRSEKLGLRQAKLLNLLLANAGKFVSTESAAKHIFNECTRTEIAALRVHVHNLRKKIEDDPVNPQYLLTIPGRGYTLARHWSGGPAR